jgi:hypothetical protein
MEEKPAEYVYTAPRVSGDLADLQETSKEPVEEVPEPAPKRKSYVPEL